MTNRVPPSPGRRSSHPSLAPTSPRGGEKKIEGKSFRSKPALEPAAKLSAKSLTARAAAAPKAADGAAPVTLADLLREWPVTYVDKFGPTSFATPLFDRMLYLATRFDLNSIQARPGLRRGQQVHARMKGQDAFADYQAGKQPGKDWDAALKAELGWERIYQMKQEFGSLLRERMNGIYDAFQKKDPEKIREVFGGLGEIESGLESIRKARAALKSAMDEAPASVTKTLGAFIERLDDMIAIGRCLTEFELDEQNPFANLEDEAQAAGDGSDESWDDWDYEAQSSDDDAGRTTPASKQRTAIDREQVKAADPREKFKGLPNRAPRAAPRTTDPGAVTTTTQKASEQDRLQQDKLAPVKEESPRSDWRESESD